MGTQSVRTFSLSTRRRRFLAVGGGVLAGMSSLWFGYTTIKSMDAGEKSFSRHERLVNYRELQWEDLVPKEWDPTKRLRAHDGSLLTDLDPKAKEMLDDLRAIWDNAPTVSALDGKDVRLPGYVVPIDDVDGALAEFLLVPYFGACIHTPPPPANQIVHVVTDKAVKGFSAMSVVWVSGKISTTRQDSPMGASGYRLDASIVAPYLRRPSSS